MDLMHGSREAHRFARRRKFQRGNCSRVVNLRLLDQRNSMRVHNVHHLQLAIQRCNHGRYLRQDCAAEEVADDSSPVRLHQHNPGGQGNQEVVRRYSRGQVGAEHAEIFHES